MPNKMESLIIGSKPIIEALSDPVVIMTIKNCMIFIGVGTTINKLTGLTTPIVLSAIPFAIWNAGEAIKYAQSGS